MTDYKSIVGKAIKVLDTNPDNSQAEGQIWFNEFTGEFKNVIINEAWSSSGPLITGRKYLGGCGTQTSALAFGGQYEATPTGETNATEEYNGSGFSAGGNLNTARKYMAGAGTQTAGLGVGGAVPPSNTVSALVEEYDGSSWTESGDLSTARKSLAAAGIQTSAVAFGGRVGGTTLSAATEEYGGTSWTSSEAMSTARKYLAGAGTQTAALAFGGKTPGNTGATEEYDGSSWTTSPGSLNDSRGYLAGSGIQTSALAFGGYNSKTSTEQYDGSTWSTKPALATGRESLAGGGTTSASVAFGGNTTAIVSLTEEFTVSTNVITAGAFSSGTNNPQTATFGGYAGTQTAAIMMGGQPNPTVKTIEYDGSAFSEGGNLPSLAHYNAAGFGTQTAAVICGGITNPGGPTGYGPLKTTLNYNGSSWSESGALNIEKYLHGAAGTQTAGLAFAGHVTPNVPSLQNSSEEYNGSSWTTGNNMNTARRNVAGTGIQTAALACAGYSPGASPDFPLANESYNGSSWTSNPNQNFIRSNAVASGPYSSAISVAGSSPAPAASDQILDQWNGTIWSTGPSMATRRYQSGHGGSGMNTSLLISGGNTGSGYSNATEEFTAETTALNVKTLTTS